MCVWILMYIVHVIYSSVPVITSKSLDSYLEPPQPWIFDCLVTKKSADARSPKSLYLSHNKYVKPTNIFKAQLTGKIMGTKVGKNSDQARPILWSTTKQQLEASDWLLLLWGKYSDLENCASADFFVTRQWTVHGCGGVKTPRINSISLHLNMNCK